MSLSREQMLAVLEIIQHCDAYANVDVMSIAQRIARDADLGTFVGELVHHLPPSDKLRVYGAALEYEQQQSVA